MGIPKNTRSGDSRILMSAEIERGRLKEKRRRGGGRGSYGKCFLPSSLCTTMVDLGGVRGVAKTETCMHPFVSISQLSQFPLPDSVRFLHHE